MRTRGLVGGEREGQKKKKKSEWHSRILSTIDINCFIYMCVSAILYFLRDAAGRSKRSSNLLGSVNTTHFDETRSRLGQGLVDDGSSLSLTLCADHSSFSLL
jgi:hypothetical protein